MKIMQSIIVVALIVLLASCSSVTVKSDYDPGVDFSKYKSFKIYDGEPIPGDALAQNPLLQKRVVQSIEEQLQSKGFTKAESGDPDFIVAAHAGVKEKTQVTNWGGYGWYDPWWGPYGGRVDVSQYEEGTLVIDFVDFQGKELAWRGLGTAVVKDYSSPEEIQRRVDHYVAQILGHFPPKGK
jgi:hypothetical protein